MHVLLSPNALESATEGTVHVCTYTCKIIIISSNYTLPSVCVALGHVHVSRLIKHPGKATPSIMQLNNFGYNTTCILCTLYSILFTQHTCIGSLFIGSTRTTLNMLILLACNTIDTIYESFRANM